MPRRIAYVVDHFPSISETWVHGEISRLVEMGWDVRIFALKALPAEHYHPSISWQADRTDYCPHRLILSPLMLRLHIKALATNPRRYLSTLAFVLANTLPSFGDMGRGVYCFVKAVYFAERLQAYAIEHIHAHFAHNRAAVAMIAARLTGITYSFTGHSQDIVIGVPMFAAKVRTARFIAVSSELMRRKLEDRFPDMDPCKVHVIRTGVDLNRFRPPAGRPVRDVPQILCVARLARVKGIDVLIDACDILSCRGLTFQCMIAGDGELRHELTRRILTRGLADRVHILGHLTDDELLTLYERATVFALPCLTERPGVYDGLPVVLIEAMAMGLPTVSTRLSAIPELIEDGVSGLLVEEKDANGLADRLERLLLDKEMRQRLALAARAKVVREYDLSETVGKLIALFNAGEPICTL
jgi:glycosyltransferase involved in cell wall biosynthesis